MARVERLRGARLAASLAGYALASLLLALRLKAPPWPLVLGAVLAAVDPLLAALYLELYVAVAQVAWGANPGIPGYMAALAPLAATAPPSIPGAAVAAAIYLGSLLAALYTVALVHRVLEPSSWPPLMRIVLGPLVSNPLSAWLGVLAAEALTVLAVRRLSEPLASSLSPRYAATLAREWLAREAERIRRASTWYHRLLSWSLGLLATLPVVFTVNAFIAALYAAVSVYAPSPRIREALQVARGAISAAVFWATGWIVSRSIRRMLSGEWSPTPSKITPVVLAVAAVLAALLYRNPLAALRAAACIIARCPPQAVPPAPLDGVIDQALRSTWEMLEATEDMLRFLIRLFWS